MEKIEKTRTREKDVISLTYLTGLNEFEILSSEKWCGWDGSFEFR